MLHSTIVKPVMASSDDLPDVPEVAVLDTCVLISSTLRALLLRLATTGWLVPVWSPVIGREWCRTAERLWQAQPAEVALQWDALQNDFPEADMGDISPYLCGLQRSDPKDWHVIAAGRAALDSFPGRKVGVVTRNIKDFHRAELRRLGLYLFDPDQLMSRLWRHDAARLTACLEDFSEQTLPGQEPLALEALLKRERLFRLNRLYQART